jgi:hypothetical protein
MKNDFWTFLKKYWHIIIIISVVTTLSLYIAFVFRNANNPDAFSYLQIAERYSKLDFPKAINGYWSPLLSWLLVPIFWLKIDPLVGFHGLNALLVISSTTVLLSLLNYRKETSQTEKLLQSLLLLTFGITLSIWSINVVTPDLLSGVVMLFAFLALWKLLETKRMHFAVLFGLLLACVYFSKSVGLFASVVVLIFLLCVSLFNKGKKELFKPIVVSAIVFAVLSLAWIGAISVKYHQLTYSTAGSINFALIGPNNQMKHQINKEDTVLNTPYPDSYSSWEDPTNIPPEKWSLKENFYPFYTFHLLKNTRSGLNDFLAASPLLLFALAGLVLIRQKEDNIYLTALSLAVITILGLYSLLFTEARYLWVIIIPVIGSFIFLATDRIARKNYFLILILAVFLFNAGLVFLNTIIFSPNQLYIYNANKSIVFEAKDYLTEGSKVATPDSINAYEVCYYSRTSCFANYNVNNAADIKKLRESGIQYYLEFQTERNTGLPVVMSTFRGERTCINDVYKQTDCPVLALTIYKIQ